MARVKNIKGTGGDKCTTCGTWIQHWENATNTKATYCAVHGCGRHDTLHGAHVKLVDSFDTKEYIVPLCPDHNHPENETPMEVTYRLVLTNH